MLQREGNVTPGSRLEESSCPGHSGGLSQLLPSWEPPFPTASSLGTGPVHCAELVGQGQEAARWDSMFLPKPGRFLAGNRCS